MDTDDDEFIRVLGFEAFKIGDDMDAVDASVGPELEQDDLAPEVAQSDRFRRVDPVETFGKLRCVM